MILCYILRRYTVVLYFIPGPAYMIGIMMFHCFSFNAPMLFYLWYVYYIYDYDIFGIYRCRRVLQSAYVPFLDCNNLRDHTAKGPFCVKEFSLLQQSCACWYASWILSISVVVTSNDFDPPRKETKNVYPYIHQEISSSLSRRCWFGKCI